MKKQARFLAVAVLWLCVILVAATLHPSRYHLLQLIGAGAIWSIVILSGKLKRVSKPGRGDLEPARSITTLTRIVCWIILAFSLCCIVFAVWMWQAGDAGKVLALPLIVGGIYIAISSVQGALTGKF